MCNEYPFDLRSSSVVVDEVLRVAHSYGEVL